MPRPKRFRPGVTVSGVFPSPSGGLKFGFVVLLNEGEAVRPHAQVPNANAIIKTKVLHRSQCAFINQILSVWELNEKDDAHLKMDLKKISIKTSSPFREG